MTKYNRQKQLNELHEKRKAETIEKVDTAIKSLLRKSEKIDFKSVEAQSGISRPTLYRIPEVKERIMFLREQQSEIAKPGDVSADVNTESKDALIEMLKRKVERITSENKELKKELSLARNGNLKDIYDNL